MEKQLATRFRKGDFITFISGDTGDTVPARVLSTEGDFAEVETSEGAISEIAKTQCFKSNAKEYAALAVPHETEDKALNGCVRRKYAELYYERSCGNRDCGDELAKRWRDMDIDAFISEAIECLGEDTVRKYDHLNNGLRRMTLGNLIRKHK